MRFGQDLVRALLRDQHANLADLELREVDGGWDNQLWRLGRDLAVRLPRTERAPALLRNEQKWLPVVAAGLPLPTPTPVRVGEPSRLFEHTWTITRWVDGDPVDHAPIARAEAADVLADFLRGLHRPAPDDAPANPARGVPLRTFAVGSENWSDTFGDVEKANLAREVWHRAVTAPAWRGAPLWLHGDLHPANVVGRDGNLAGVIDFGELCGGDPATDLSAAWTLLPDGAAQRFFEVYERADEATIARARGWAVLRAVGLIEIGRNGRLGLPGGKPTWERAGHAALRRVLTP